MSFLDFRSYPLWINLAVFAAAAAAVWFAGARVSGYANTISERTGIGKAVIGLILLGGITSLPEVAVSVTSSLNGNAALAVNNLLGGVAMQVAIIAIADAAYGKGAITAIIAQPIVLLQGVLGILLLVLVAAGISVGEVQVVGVGLWASALPVLYIGSIWLLKNYQGEPAWLADHGGERKTRGKDREQSGRNDEQEDTGDRKGEEKGSLRRTILYTAAAGLVILVAGFVLAKTGDALAEQTGLGSSFVGAVLVAISTSLPEVSTVLAAVRIKQYEMAFSDIFGTNLFDLVLIFLVDAVYSGGPVLNEVGTFSLFAALLGIVVTTVYLAGLIERKDRTFLRMGIDSLVVILVYAGGLMVLYTLR